MLMSSECYIKVFSFSRNNVVVVPLYLTFSQATVFSDSNLKIIILVLKVSQGLVNSTAASKQWYLFYLFLINVQI